MMTIVCGKNIRLYFNRNILINCILFVATLRTDKCKVMRSKMRPLWLVFKNSDLATKKVSVIYKNGDGNISHLAMRLGKIER